MRDVFISFRGLDIRNDFLSHLHKALCGKELDVFVDLNLERGEEITPALLKTIEESYVSIVIISKNYADSPWCLDELVKIIECKKTRRQVVLPVFYRVDPTDVDELTGSFGDAFAKHRRESKNDTWGICKFLHKFWGFAMFLDQKMEEKELNEKVWNWSQALREITEISGLVSDNIKSDSELVEEIVNHVLGFLDKLYIPLSSKFDKGRFVGIDSRVKRVESLLFLGEAGVRTVGIYGMGGIGKTTIAGEVFERICRQFTSSCFITNVRQRLEKDTHDSLQSKILSKIFGSENSINGNPIRFSDWTKLRLSRRKVLIILDDVTDSRQIKFLIGEHPDCYGPGSRIIQISRNKQLLKNWGAEIYEVEKLNYREAHQLFHLHALKKDVLREEYKELSKRAVKYVQGLPLALELGSNLYKKSVEEWESELEKLKDESDGQIQKILKISYDGLDEIERQIFLDIACFFNGEDKNRVVDLLDAPGSISGISKLADRSLISVANNELHMHDLLQQMGKDICVEEIRLGKRCRLWRPNDICDVLRRAEGTEAIKGISLDMSKIEGIELSPTVFEGMYKLRWLQFYNPVGNSSLKLHLPKGLKVLSDELRLLHWDQWPCKFLPLSFCAKNLVELRMPYSQLTEHWNGVQELGNLKILDLSYSEDLMKIPDLRKASNLEVLRLECCGNLVEIPSSLKHSRKLKELDLSFCKRLRQHQLPNLLDFKSLEILNLNGWSSITDFPKIPCSITHLRLLGTGIKQVPSSIECLSHLSVLNLKSCNKLGSLPNSICNLKYLKYLIIDHCVNLHELPENIGNLESLIIFSACGAGIKKLPTSGNQLSKLNGLVVSQCEGLVVPPLTVFPQLEKLDLGMCGLTEFSKVLWHLKSPYVCLGRNNFESIPESIKYSKIDFLDLRDCKRLKYLPELSAELRYYLLRNCTSLKSAAILLRRPIINPTKLRTFEFDNCINLDWDECNRFLDDLLAEEINNQVYLNPSLQLRIPGSELPKRIMYKNNNGSSLFLSFTQPQHHFTLCAVCDPKLLGGVTKIRCTAFCIDEFGSSQEYDLDYILWIETVEYYECDTIIHSEEKYDLDFHSEHIFLWRYRKYIPGKSVCFNFFTEDLGTNVSCDAILKCGVHIQLEKDQKLLLKRTHDHGATPSQEEEEPPPKRLKHSDDQATRSHCL